MRGTSAPISRGGLWAAICLGPALLGARAEGEVELKADYGLPERRVVAEDLGLAEGEVLSARFSGISEYDADGGHHYDEYALKLAIQGLINRSGPLLWYDFQEYMGAGFPACSFWPTYYDSPRPGGHGLTFVPPEEGLDALLRRVAPLFNGIIVYEPRPSDNTFLALNLANLNFCLPVSARIHAEHRGALGALPIVARIERGRWRREEIYEWMLAEVLPLTDRSTVHSAGATFDDLNLGSHGWHFMHGLDYPFRGRHFIFNLSCTPVPEGSYDFIVDGDPAMAGLFDRIMAALAPPAPIFGWLEPEGAYCERVSEFGHYVNCSAAAPNLSFHAAVTPLKPPPYPQDAAPKVRAPEGKCYLSAVVNECDAIKTHVLLFGGVWLDPQRGETPISYPLNPANVELFPAVFEFLFNSRTDNDYFVAFPGYHAPPANPDFGPLARLGHSLMPLMNLREVEYWNLDRAAVETLGETMGADLRGITLQPHRERPSGEALRTQAGGIPVLRYARGLHYADYSEPDALAARVREVAEARSDGFSRPCFLPIYGLHSARELSELRSRLDPDRFEFVDQGTLFHLAAQVPPEEAHPPPPHATQARWSAEALQDAGSWVVFNGGSVSPSAAGLRVGVGEGKTWEVAGLRDVQLPPGATHIRVRVSELHSAGADAPARWIVKLTGNLDGFGLTDTWLPFGNGSTWIGDAARKLDRRIPVSRGREPLHFLELGIIGEPGSYTIFEGLEFVKTEEG